MLENSYGTTNEEVRQFLIDLFRFGCISGMIAGMVWYSDTESFFDRHYEEIEVIRLEYEDLTGETLRIPSQLKNFLAWFAYEQTAFAIASELGLEF